MLQEKFESLRRYNGVFAQKYEKDDFIEWVVDMHGMGTNGYSYSNDDNFRLENEKPCYIPENADCEEDVYSYQDLKKEVEDWLQTDGAKSYIKATNNQFQSVENWVQMLYEDLEYQSPITRLLEYSYNY